MILTEKLEKRFGENIAVNSLNLEVKKGEVFGFLGPNGAGKTTTVRLLSTLISPTSGDAVVNGYKVGVEDQNIRRSVGVLTETPGLYENLSAVQNLEIFAELYEVENIKIQIDKYLHMLGLNDRKFDIVGTFSKGMKQKLAIARSLIHEPKILFLDEPTASLDPESSKGLREFISELRSEGRTIFICTHNLDEADRLCDRICVFKNEILVIDSPANLRSSLFGRRIVFHLRGYKESFASSLNKFDFVKDVKNVENKLLVTLEDPNSQNPVIIKDLIAKGAEIIFVGELRHSLEDVYLELIKSN